MDLEAGARQAGFSSTKDMFGKVILACSLLTNELTLIVLLAVMHLQTSQAPLP
jgi:hypothetical protein